MSQELRQEIISSRRYEIISIAIGTSLQVFGWGMFPLLSYLNITVPTWLNGLMVITGLGVMVWGFYSLLHNNREREATERKLIESGQNIPYELLSDEGKRERKGHLMLAVEDMSVDHGHMDLNGLADAIWFGKSFNEDLCWQCGKPRFGYRPNAVTKSKNPDV